jgi:hypothetical protein
VLVDKQRMKLDKNKRRFGISRILEKKAGITKLQNQSLLNKNSH